MLKEGEHKHPNRHVRTYSLNRIFFEVLAAFFRDFVSETDRQTNKHAHMPI